MRIYPESSEETLRARKLLTQWTGDGSLNKEQYQRLEQDTVSDLRITNIFLRLVLFFFTMIGVAAAVALFFTIFLSQPSQQTTGIFLLIFVAVSYTGSEVAVTQARRWRHCFALDLVSLQSLVCISRRDDLRHLPARLLDAISFGAACLHLSVVCSRTDLYSAHSLPPPIRLP